MTMINKPKILETHDNELIVYMNGKVKSIPNNSYSILKKMYFGDNRIMYTFADFVQITETYNPRIFNLVYDKFMITVRQEYANQICDCILEHYKTGTYVKYKELFLNVYSEEHEDEIVESFILGLSPYIKIEKKTFKHNTGLAPVPVYLINDNFAIDSKGTSYYKRESDNTWAFLCTVVQSHNQSYKVQLKGVGWAKLSEKMSDVISKIIFFLHPNIKDTVFTNQLHEHSPSLYKTIIMGRYLNDKQ